MQSISTTQLGTQMQELIQALQQGKPVKLMHQSRQVGLITPEVRKKKFIPFSIDEFKKAMKAYGPVEQLDYKERDKRYRKHLEEKYGSPVS